MDTDEHGRARTDMDEEWTGKGLVRGLVLVLVLVLVVVLGGCAAPMPVPRRVGVREVVYLPVAPVGGYRWAARGFGHPPEAWAVSHEELIGERPTWFHDWWWDCGRWALDGAVYVPSVARAWYPEVLRCDDGRPLLVLNEPEDPNQANLSPTRAAELLHTASLAWRRGEVWCCGTQVQHLGYAQQLLAAYRAAYGEEWPAAGWHVHVYSQRAGRTYNATAVTDVMEGLAALDAFVAWAAGEGVLGRGVVISEYGVLSGRVVEPVLMETFERELDARPVVRSRAWFSVRYAPWTASDLVEEDGRLTALGRMWEGSGERRLETGDWRAEIGDRRLETGDRRLETGD